MGLGGCGGEEGAEEEDFDMCSGDRYAIHVEIFPRCPLLNQCPEFNCCFSCSRFQNFQLYGRIFPILHRRYRYSRII